jgi:Cys-tRNA(Pro)/Cys-tRNA(Cys) deacylase
MAFRVVGEMKTLAARVLDRWKVNYELREYSWSEDELDAVTVARKIGLPPEAVFKTLVARGDRTGVLIACVPANVELDLKKLASVSGNKKVELVSVKEIQSLTGYVRGGVSPIGAKKDYPLFIDESVQLVDAVSISAGARGLQMLLAPDDLQRVTVAQLADLSKMPESSN